MLSEARLRELQAALKTKRVGLFGDLCVDIYWHADMTRSELSRETPHFPLPVTRERVSLGAGGNVAANLAALGPGEVQALSVLGEDWRGALLRERLAAAKIGAGLCVTVPGRVTNAYCKPMRHGISDVVYEDPRLDFENAAPPDGETESLLLERLAELARRVDVLCVSDQFRCGCVTPRLRQAVCALGKTMPVIADSRCNAAAFTDCILKPNEVECWRAVYGEADDGWLAASVPALECAAALLAVRNRAVVFCTLGARGSFLTNGETAVRTPARAVEGPVDICGAGDTSLAAFACALAAGASYEEAAALAALASAVTVRKLGETGTASFDEIAALLQA